MQSKQVIIIGGGVAGLSCLNALLDKNIPAILLESSSIGSPKMCGEFVSPLAADQLKKWQIECLQPIAKAIFSVNGIRLQIDLKYPAVSIARSEAEILLAQRARHLGGDIRENVDIQAVITAENQSPHRVVFFNGEELAADTLVFATGKYNPLTSAPSIPVYYGVKMRLPHVFEQNTLLMFSIPRAYLGIVPLNQHISNSAWLIQREMVDQAGSLDNAIRNIISNHSELNIFSSFDLEKIICLQGHVGEFGLKATPKIQRIYWIGDALASFPPAIGYGFAHSIHSALMAVDYIINNDAEGYRKRSHFLINKKLMLGKYLHFLMLHSKALFPLMFILKMAPGFINLMEDKINHAIS